MIDVITKIFCATILGITVTYSINKIGNYKYNILKFMISSIIISIITYVSYFSKYNTELSLLKIVLIIIIIKLVYNDTLYKTIIFTLISMILLFIGDIIISLLLTGIVPIITLKTKWYYILPCNLIVCLISIIITNIRFIYKIINKIINKIDEHNKILTFVMFCLIVIVIINLFYNISLNFEWNEKFIINIVLSISGILIICIFLKDKLDYSLLVEKYDALFDYFSEMAESIDDLHLTTHEFKNQIAIVSNYIDEKKYNQAKEYIDTIANSINKDEKFIVNLKDIPTGGLKGLLYYKIIIAKNQKVEIVLDIGKNVKRIFKKLSENDIKIITRIVGVYIDNAVSEAKSKNKIVNIEIYNLNEELNFAISNKISKNINIDDIGKKGFTNKGKGHGQGLYLVNKLINRNRWLKSENKIINNYYITKLIVDTKNIG